MKIIDFKLSNGKTITVVLDKIETFKTNHNKKGHSFITLTSGKSISVVCTVDKIKELISQQ